MKKVKLGISVFDYDDYRAFLQAAYQDLNGQEEAFSYRYLQKKAGFSPLSNHFWQVVKGRTSLSPKAAAAYGRALGMNPSEQGFFLTLAAMNQAKDDESRTLLMAQLKQYRRYRPQQSVSRLTHEFYRLWFLPALRTMVALDDFTEDPRWIARRLNPSPSVREIEQGMAWLVEAGYLIRDAQGRLRQAQPLVGDYEDRREDSPVARLAVRNYHRFMLDLAKDSLENLPQDRRYLIGNTMAISHGQALRLKDAIKDFMATVESIIVEDEAVEALYRLNIQFFTLTSDGGTDHDPA